MNVTSRIKQLADYCEKEDFKGWDPYDGLNSKVLKAIPFLLSSPRIRMVVIQFFKRSPINLRRMLAVPKVHNAKGIALFLSGYCNLYLSGDKDVEVQIRYLADLLLTLKSVGFSGACWGYSFDWQSKAFFLPAGTPTVVATSFAVEALLSAYKITGDNRYRDAALSSADFILKDLNRIPKGEGFMFSYSPLDIRAVYNASLLGVKTLSLLYEVSGNSEYKRIASIAAKAACEIQNGDGSFPHSDQIGNKWRDNFHTGFKLESLAIYEKCCGDLSFHANIEKGYSYWINNFFDRKSGKALYYDRGMSPDYVDLHCFAQSVATLYKLGKLEEEKDLVDKEQRWVFENMWNNKGYFIFQIKHNIKNRIMYMRWPNAWCFYAISYIALSESKEKNENN